MPILPTFSRYKIEQDLDNHFHCNNLGGFRKPNPGMLRLAIADWVNKHDLLLGTIDPKYWIPETITSLDTNKEMFKRTSPSVDVNRPILMVGDRPEDKEAAAKANVKFLSHTDFYKSDPSKQTIGGSEADTERNPKPTARN